MPLVHAFVNPVADDLSVVGTRPSHWNAAHDLSGLNLNELQGDSDDVSEGVTNLYYTPTRFNTAFAAKSTTDLAEGSNLYFTDERAQDAIGAMVDSTIVYVDSTPLLTRAALTGAITAAQGSNATLLGSFTKSQLDTAVSDGNVLYVGDVTQYTDELVDDRVATLIQNGTGITWSYNDGLGTLTPTVTITQYTDELAQDAVGAMVDATLVYVDATPLLTRAALTGAITASQGSNSTALGSFTKSQLDGAVSDGNVLYVGDVVSASNHDLLDGAQNQDTLAGTVARGDLIVGNATPKWARKAVGTTGQYLGTDGTDVLWRAQSTLDHGSIGGLADDDHTQYALLAGRSGGQGLIGGTGASDNLTLRATSHATNGTIDFIFEGPVVGRRENSSGSLIAGYARVGSLVAPSNTTAGDLTAKRLMVGTDTAFDATSGYVLFKETGVTSIFGVDVNVGMTNAAASVALRVTGTQAPSSGTTGFAAGVQVIPTFAPASAKGYAQAIGIESAPTTGSDAGAITLLQGIYTVPVYGSQKPTTAVGVAIADYGDSGVTTVIGLQIVTPSAGTNKYVFDITGGNANYIPVRANSTAKKLYTITPFLGPYIAHHDPTTAVININSTAYIAIGVEMIVAQAIWTHFRIVAGAGSNAVGQTVTLQLATTGAPGTSISAAGGDLVITNTLGNWDSGWIAVNTAITDGGVYRIGCKGSNATVDILAQRIQVLFKYDP